MTRNPPADVWWAARFVAAARSDAAGREAYRELTRRANSVLRGASEEYVNAALGAIPGHWHGKRFVRGHCKGGEQWPLASTDEVRLTREDRV